jgi:transposase
MPGRLTAEEIVTIKTLASKGVAVRAIARQLGKNESSVRHHAREGDERREDGRRNKVAKCDALAPEIEAWATAHSKGERPTNVRELYEWLVAERHYDGSYKAVVRWVRRRWGQPPIRTYRRVETPPGAQCQTDWGHFNEIVVAREVVKLYAFVMTLSHSRGTSVAWSPRRDMLHWLGCHNRAFERLGGVAATNRIDNERTAMMAGAGAHGKIHDAYRAYARQMKFHIDACEARHPEGKGKAEAKVKLARALGPSRREYDAWEELEDETATKFEARAKRTRCPATGTTVFEAWEQERELLRPLPQTMPRPFDAVVNRQVKHDCMIHFEGRQYTVPFVLVGRAVEVHGCERTLEIYCDGQLVQEHPRGTPQRVVIDPRCFDGESTDRVIAPMPLGRMGKELQRIASMPVETRPIDLYAALAEVAR